MSAHKACLDLGGRDSGECKMRSRDVCVSRKDALLHEVPADTVALTSQRGLSSQTVQGGCTGSTPKSQIQSQAIQAACCPEYKPPPFSQLTSSQEERGLLRAS